MKLLKTIVALTFSMLILTVAGYAQVWTDVSIDISPSVQNKCVTITGKVSGMSEKMVTAVLQLVNDGESELSQSIYGHAQGVSNAAGDFTLAIPFGENMPSGKYRVVVGGEWVAYGNTDILKSEFDYFDEAEQLSFCEAVNAATESTITGVLMNANDVIFPNDENLYEYSTFAALFIKVKQESFGDSFDMTKESAKIIEDINYCYKIALSLSLLNEGTDVSKKETAIIDLLNGLSMSESIIDYRSKLMCLMNGTYIPYTGLSDFEEKAVSIISVEEINNSSIEGITGVLEKFKDAFGINLDTYNTLNKMTVNRYLWNKSFSNTAEICTAFNNAVNTVKNLSQTQGGGSSNKVGSSSSGGFSGMGSAGNTSNNEVNSNIAVNNAFTDLDTAQWAKEHIEKLYKLGIVAGRGNNEFAPDALVLREEAARMISLSLGLTAAVNADFTDMAENAWYVPYVSTLKDSGIVSGYPDGSFGVGKPMTREEVAAIIYRALSKKSIVLGKYNNLALFSDKEQISDYALEAVEVLQQAGLISGMGDNTFAPASYVTRAQLAKMLSVMLDLVSKS